MVEREREREKTLRGQKKKKKNPHRESEKKNFKKILKNQIFAGGHPRDDPDREVRPARGGRRHGQVPGPGPGGRLRHRPGAAGRRRDGDVIVFFQLFGERRG